MISRTATNFVFILSLVILPVSALADLKLYTGKIDVVKTSGKSCGSIPVNERFLLVLASDDQQGGFSGIFGSDNLTVGRLSGIDLKQLAVSYPYTDSDIAEGHSMALSVSGDVLSGELRDKNVEPSSNSCNFDLAKLNLTQSAEEDVLAVFQQLSARFDAKMAHSAAISSLRSGALPEAVTGFEKALSLAEKAFPQKSTKLSPYLSGLVNSYMRSGRFADVVALHAERYPVIGDEAVRYVFDEYLLKSLLHLGRSAMKLEEYQSALSHFRKAYDLNYKNREAIAAIMSAYVRSGQHDEAIAFLEDAEKRLEGESSQRDVRGAIALVQFQKAKQDDKSGKPAEAEAALLKAIRLDPEMLQYRILLARWRHKSGNYNEADNILKKALEQFKDAADRSEITEAREKMRQTEIILKKLSRNGA